MRLAQIEDGVVTNVIVVAADDIPDWCATWPECPDAGPGWAYDGAAFAPPEDQPET